MYTTGAGDPQFAWRAASASLLCALQGHVAATSPTFQHSLPSIFPEPAKFVPDRFVKDPNIKVNMRQPPA